MEHVRSLSAVIVVLNRGNCTTSTLVQTVQNSLLGIRMIKAHFVVVRAIFGTRREVKKATTASWLIQFFRMWKQFGLLFSMLSDIHLKMLVNFTICDASGMIIFCIIINRPSI